SCLQSRSPDPRKESMGHRQRFPWARLLLVVAAAGCQQVAPLAPSQQPLGFEKAMQLRATVPTGTYGSVELEHLSVRVQGDHVRFSFTLDDTSQVAFGVGIDTDLNYDTGARTGLGGFEYESGFDGVPSRAGQRIDGHRVELDVPLTDIDGATSFGWAVIVF